MVNNNSNDRLDRIEAIVESLARSAQAQSNEHGERIRFLEELASRQEETMRQLVRIEEAQNRMLASLDDDRPTILRRLNSIENKIDSLIERDRE
ncbi:hypothetical protein IQ238_26260 [Pleurocapsales cyanobacterium LEGE 06147]|nr:hypothetical protein [Pleurocapsales cyanobacterium LEGE 06147]